MSNLEKTPLIKLIWSTPDIDGLLAYIARVSNPDNQTNPNISGLLNHMMREGHASPFEMCNVCFELNTTRDIGRQVLRHKSIAVQEFCISGDSKITMIKGKGDSKKITIAELYEQFHSKYWSRSANFARVFDEETKLLTKARVLEVFKTGVKPCFKLTLENGKTIVATKEHKFLTFEGFKPLEELNTDSYIGCNGVQLYKDKDWLLATKIESFKHNGLAYIAEQAGVSTHTIRKWLQRHKISFTKLEVSKYSPIWNKGLAVELQPRFGKLLSEDTRNTMREKAKKGSESNLYKNGNASSDSIPFFKHCRQWGHSYKNRLLKEQNYLCALSGEPLTYRTAEVDHIVPVALRPDLAYDYENIQAVTKVAHRGKTNVEMRYLRKTARFNRVLSIEPFGEVETYDLEVEHSSHNYVANGMIVHNSQRYQHIDSLEQAPLRECRLQDNKNRQNSIDSEDVALNKWWYEAQLEVRELSESKYHQALIMGVAKEQARALLPEGLTASRIYANGNMRSWIFYLKQRLHPSTQKEHRLLAQEILNILRELAPVTMQAFFGE